MKALRYEGRDRRGNIQWTYYYNTMQVLAELVRLLFNNTNTTGPDELNLYIQVA